VDLRFEESPLSGLKITLGNVGGTWGMGLATRRTRVLPEHLSWHKTTGTLLPFAGPTSPPLEGILRSPVHETTSKELPLRGELCATNV